jgi:UDP-N-acetylmuramoylalanine--D-glutamate ligase
VEFRFDDPLPAEPRIPGPHNRENAAAATAAARVAGIGDEAIAEALRTFPGVPHRIELVRERGGIRYVNDSKATNVAAALRALASFPASRLHVILGGRGKSEPYEPLAAAFGPGDRAYLIGESADVIADALDGAGVPSVRAGELATALELAASAAAPGDVVLLSPACASFDQFENFEARGDAFRRLVEGLP